MRVIDPSAPLDDLLKFDGVPRTELEARLRELVPRLKLAELRATKRVIEGCSVCVGGRDYRALLANLTSTQARCTTLLDELRAYRRTGICLPGVWCSCGAFNGFAREQRTECRCCERALGTTSFPPGPPP